MVKRANGEGTLSKRKDKSGKVIGWRAGVTVGYKPDGSQDRRWVSGKTQAEVQEKLRALQSEIHTGMLSDTEGLTVAAYLTRWYESKERAGVKPNTVQSYRDTGRLYIVPHIGRVKLEKLRPLDVEHMLSGMTKAGKSPQLLAYALRVLKMALRQAVRWQMLPRNVAEGITAPRFHRQEMQVWTAEQVAAFLDVSQEHRLHAVFYLALMTGMRRGELLGLKWRDIDWEKARLTVRNNLVAARYEAEEGRKLHGKPVLSKRELTLQTPKTAGSRRTIVLSPGTIAKLKEHQARQEAEKANAAEAWSCEGYVFASELGTPTDPRSLGRAYSHIVRKAGVPPIRFHDLRHTAASLMIHRKIPPKVVSERLGHADVAFTLRVYAHLYDDQREEAAFDLSDLFPRSGGAPN
ncbi:tyrosine-type recombinase/integrase [Deinococcus fonticola]|uniref:tyrosine-type recombinase/integrase n=1 Tax=Deinococcus fonticola TaxID=2528713 RepID=UPI001074F85A|nr:site-specific integrase [Deinococcus fonticola]